MSAPWKKKGSRAQPRCNLSKQDWGQHALGKMVEERGVRKGVTKINEGCLGSGGHMKHRTAGVVKWDGGNAQRGEEKYIEKKITGGTVQWGEGVGGGGMPAQSSEKKARKGPA